MNAANRDYSALLWLIPLLLAMLLFKNTVLDRQIAPVVVFPNAEHVPTFQEPIYKDFGDISLLGYRFETPERLVVMWRANRAIKKLYAVRVVLNDGRVVPVRDIRNRYPGHNVTTNWQAGDIIRDVYDLPLDQGIRPIGYHIHVGLIDLATDQPVKLLDSPDQYAETVPFQSSDMRIKVPSLLTVESAEATATIPLRALDDAVFGTQIALRRVGWTLQDGALDVGFIWEATAAPALDYTVFVHVVDVDGTLVANADAQPLNGVYPTSFWEQGEVLYELRHVSADLPPGNYQIHTGFYHLETGQRLELDGGLGSSVQIGVAKVFP